MLIETGAFSQQPVFTQYTVANGLPHSTIFRLHQQKNGLLWIGTDNGLCSFDGKNFKILQFNSSIGFNSIMGIIDLSPDTLMFYVYRKGYYLLHKHEISLFHTEVDQLKDVIYMKPDVDGKIWLFNTKGKAGYFYQRKYYPFDLPGGIQPIRAMEITPHCIYFGTDKGLFRFDRNGQGAYRDSMIGNEEITGINYDDNNRLSIGTKKNTYELYFDAGRIINRGKVNIAPIVKILEDKNGNIWMQKAHDGVRLRRNLTNPPRDFELSPSVVNDMLIDHEGNVWVGTYGEGLFCYTTPNTYNQIEMLQPRVLYESGNGDIMVGGLGQLLVVRNGELHNFQKLQLSEGRLVTHIFQSIDSNLLISTTNEIFQLKGNDVSLAHNLGKSVNATGFDPANSEKLLLGSDGLFTYDKELRRYVAEEKFAKMVYTLCNDKSGNLWIGTKEALLKLGRDNVMINVTGEIFGPCWIYDLLIDANDILWAASSRGVIRCENQDCELIPLNTDKYLAIPCKALTLDKDNHLWAGTPKGVFKESGKSFKKAEFPFNASLEDIYDIMIDQKDVLWIAATDRLISVNINSLSIDWSPLELYFGDILLGGKRIYHSEKNEVKYDPDFHNLEVNFSVIAFSRADQVVCQYRLIGHDPGWQLTGDRRIVYHALEPGNYQLILRVKFKGQEKYSIPKKLSFTILPPYYKTWWFRSVVIILLISTMLLILYFKQRNISAKKAQEIVNNNRLNELRHNALNAMMSPHFINNTLNSIQHMVRTQSKIKSSAFISQFSKLIRSSLETAFKNHVSLYDELERLKLFLSLEKSRLEDKFDYEIYVSGEIDTEQIKIPNLVIQPIVENAIWHGILPKKQAGKVWVSINVIADEQLQIVVIDNGIGFHKSTKALGHQSMGIDLVSEKLKLSNAANRLEVEEMMESRQVSGTKVTMNIFID